MSVSTNTVSDSDVNIYLGTDGTGLAAGHWSVTGNTVTGATDKVPGGASGFGDGIQLDSTSNAVTISGNTVTGSAENGISVFSATGATLSSNTVNHNLGDGIYIGGPGSFVQSASTGNTISNNTLQKNGQDGILADSNSASNQFTANKLTKNVATTSTTRAPPTPGPGTPAHRPATRTREDSARRPRVRTVGPPHDPRRPESTKGQPTSRRARWCCGRGRSDALRVRVDGVRQIGRSTLRHANRIRASPGRVCQTSVLLVAAA